MLKLKVPLAPYTYAKIGGPAQRLMVVHSVSELKAAVKLAQTKGWPLTVLGSASNVIIADAGLTGLVIIDRAQAVSQPQPGLVRVASGTLMSQLIHFTIQHGLAGLAEFLGIPGTVGGALYNNSHHLNHLIGDLVTQVTIIDERGRVRRLPRSACQFAYDASIFQKQPWIILSATFNLSPAEPQSLQTLARAALQRRRQTQPLNFPSSGCMFKNPEKTAKQRLETQKLPPFAGFLIDQCGLKGVTSGGAQVSPLHANFIVNLNHASAQDVVRLSNRVRRQVHDRFGVWLEREIFFLGHHPQLDSTPKESLNYG
ncbi:UDP-N-acetylenolpyruvoylglucosamine reductase [Microgenomates group bacterium RBG_16_45_19]|nr:MAG: UDP-N-acetylenolpyruvoylglucosamine reductase [Microgenomates group bacterium RBG_16_45_19]